MTGLNPVGMMGITKMGAFDFPTEVCADKCKPNVDPLGIHPHVAAWFGTGSTKPGHKGFGSPTREQGWPVLMETVPEIEDPDVAPWVDMIIDYDKEAVLFHSGRLSGDMAVELADNTHSCHVVAHAIPYKGNSAIQIGSVTTTLVPGSNIANEWFWLTNNATTHELLMTVEFKIKPAALLTQGEVYKLLVEWEFHHKVNGSSHHEPFCGFDDSITFKVNEKTVV